MQIPSSIQIRAPWPDEIARLQHYLPSAFLWDAEPPSRVAVMGRVERLIGAATLSLHPFREQNAAILSLRVDERPERQVVGTGLIEPLLSAAWEQEIARVYLASTVELESKQAAALSALGFVPDTINKIYEMDARKLHERLDRIYQRLRTSGFVPETAELTILHAGVIGRTRSFLQSELPQSASVMALETAGYKPEHSLALLLDGEVKGVILCRRDRSVSTVGLRAVAKELRGGIAWANLLLLHASMRSGVETGLELCRFEFNPELHPDTQQLADVTGARLIGERALFRTDNPEKPLTSSRPSIASPSP